jgi:hypothetical protein
MVLAGRSGLGTHAACFAATDPDNIGTIKGLLSRKGVNLDDHNVPFYAVTHISSIPADPNHEIDPDSLEIPYAAPFERR